MIQKGISLTRSQMIQEISQRLGSLHNDKLKNILEGIILETSSLKILIGPIPGDVESFVRETLQELKEEQDREKEIQSFRSFVPDDSVTLMSKIERELEAQEIENVRASEALSELPKKFFGGCKK